jgi:hypothetical protein
MFGPARLCVWTKIRSFARALPELFALKHGIFARFGQNTTPYHPEVNRTLTNLSMFFKILREDQSFSRQAKKLRNSTQLLPRLQGYMAAYRTKKASRDAGSARLRKTLAP